MEEQKQKRLEQIVEELRLKVSELEDLKREFERKELHEMTAQQTTAYIEEIHVPPLESLKAKKKPESA
ncbi:MAG: hypothetical protein V1847_01985 [Candidatus Diapherotrites archaeon]